MKKDLLLIAIVSLFLISGTIIAADTPETVVIEGKTYKKDRKGPVTLTHVKHVKDYGVKCIDCHHEYKDGKNIWTEGDKVKKCGECHDPAKSESNVKKLMVAFHKNCQGCHTEKSKEGIKTPDKKKCKECHQE